VTSENAVRDANVTIRRLEAVYVVPCGHPSPEELQARMDALAREQLAGACRRVFEQALDPRDPSLWFIRRLSVGLTLDAGALDSGQVARAWGAQLCKSVLETFSRGADNESVVYFPDRAAYLAQFVADLAEGRAWDKWYYEDSLRSLPVGQAIAQALGREPEHLPATLRRLLANSQLEHVLDALGESGARMVYETSFESYPSSSLTEREAANAVLAAWPAAFALSPGSNPASSQAALRLLAATLNLAPALETGRDLRRTIDHLRAFAGLLSHVPDPEKLALNLAAGDLKGATEKAQAAGADPARDSLLFVERLAQNDLAWMRQLLETLGPGATAAVRPSGPTNPGHRSFVTSFGGIFLLLPSLLELGIEEVIAEAPYPGLPEPERRRALRLILLLKLLGADRAREAANDAALLLAAGLDKPVLPQALASFGELATEAMNQECLRGWAGLMFRKAYASGRYLSLESTVTDGTGQSLLLRDLESDVWLWALDCQGPVEKTRTLLRGALEDLAAVLEVSQGCMVIGPEASVFLDAEGTSAIRRPIAWLKPGQKAGLKPIPLDSGGTHRTVWVEGSSTLLPEDLSRLSKILPTRRPQERDLQYLTLAGSQGARSAMLPNLGFDLAWSLSARAVLRSFARKLMGFDQSSLMYLRENFFSGTSSIHVQDSTISVELPACPLAVILNMAGVHGLTYSVPWLDSAQVTLSLPSN